MAATDKSFEELRKEHKELSDYTGRVAIIILAILFLLTISYSRAWDGVHGEKAKPKLCEISKAQKDYHDCTDYYKDPPDSTCDYPNVSYVFGFQLEQYSEDPTACAPSPSQSPSPSPSPSPCQSPSPSPSPAPSPAPSPCNARLTLSERTQRKKDLCAYRRGLETDLETEAQKWFAVKAPIPGADINIDNRSWVFTLPILFCVCGVYLHILRKKQNLLEAVAIQRLQEVKPEEITELDRLYFAGDRSFLRFPSRLTTLLFVPCYLFLPAYLIYDLLYVTWGYRAILDPKAVFTAVFLVLICAFYAGAYGHSASNQLERQISAIEKADPGRNRLSDLLGYGRNLLEWLARRVAPAITLAAGSILVTASLFLSFGAHKGYAFALGRHEFWWTDPSPYLDNLSRFYFIAERIADVSSVLPAILGVLVILPAKYSLFNRKWIRTLALGVAGGALLFTLVSDSITAIYGFVDWTGQKYMLIKITVQLITGYAWFHTLYATWKGSSDRRWRGVLLVFFAPVYLICLVSLWSKPGWGFLVSFLGTSVLLVGFAQLQYLSRPPADSPSPDLTGK
jgi:hypothetical protein